VSTEVSTVVVVLVAALGVWVIVAFNRLVRARNLMREGWSGIDVQLRRRRNLVPNLVETVKAYGRHEKGLLERVTQLRADAPRDEPLGETQNRENLLTDQLKRLFALAETYPDLKADTNYLDLQRLLTEIEDHLQMARRYYNGAVRDYNTRVESFPGNLVAALFRFRQGEFFQVEAATERAAPKVEM